MIARRRQWAELIVALGAVVAVATGCSFDGLNSLPVPGAQGTGAGSYELTATIPSANNLIQNSPVLMNDATVGSIGAVRVHNWKARLTLRLNKGTRVPTGSHVAVGITSVLGSLNLQIVPPPRSQGGYFTPGSAIPEEDCPSQQNIAAPQSAPPQPDINQAQQVADCTYPTVEQTLSSLSVVLNGGGLAQVGDVVHELNSALAGRTDVIKTLIPRLTTLVGDLNSQRGDIVSALDNVDRLSAVFNRQAPTIDKALQDAPRILKTLVDERKNLTDTLGAVGRLSTQVDTIVSRNGSDITTIVSNLRPVLDQLAGTGDSLVGSLGLLATFPFAESAIPSIIKGDYVNAVINLDLTNGRVSRVLLRSIGMNAPGTLYGPEAVMGRRAGNAARNVDPFRAPLATQGHPR